jgi:hypothetical protein
MEEHHHCHQVDGHCECEGGDSQVGLVVLDLVELVFGVKEVRLLVNQGKERLLQTPDQFLGLGHEDQRDYVQRDFQCK